MTSRDFRDFPTIKEVECNGESLSADVKLMSLRLYRADTEYSSQEPKVLATLNVFENSCMTFTEYSSCQINTADTHRSRLRILVHDLIGGESREYGCTANTMASLGVTGSESWEIIVHGHVCKFIILVSAFIFVKIIFYNLP